MGPGAVPGTGRNEKPSECYIFIMQFRMESAGLELRKWGSRYLKVDVPGLNN
jgi:hypothetical protein